MSYLHFIRNNSKNGFCKQKWSGKRTLVTVVAAYSGKNWPMKNKQKKQNTSHYTKLYLEFEAWIRVTSFHNKYTDFQIKIFRLMEEI